MVRNFVIPLTKDELLTSHAGQYSVEEIVPSRTISHALDGNLINLQQNLICSIFNDTLQHTILYNGSSKSLTIAVTTT